MQNRYDVVIVGGGSAGCAAAERLSADPQRRVLLLEAGPDPDPVPEIIADASMLRRLRQEWPYVEQYPTLRSIDGSTFNSLACQIMGGGSSVNVMAAPRPTKRDLDAWAARGNPDWSYDRLLPVLKGLESDQDFPDSAIHGFDGPLHIQRRSRLDTPMPNPVQALVDRAQGMGLPLCPDLNGPDPLGVCTCPFTIKDGRRQSTAVAYLRRARERDNLHIVADATVTSLRVDGRRVQQVLYVREGRVRTAIGDQVVLSAGVYHSPQILLLSGIGPARELERLGIPVAHALNGVGENYQDHGVVVMQFEQPTQFHHEWVMPGLSCFFMIKSDPGLPGGDFHILMLWPNEMDGGRPVMPVSLHLLEQHNRGRVALPSTDPRDQLIVDAGLLEHPDDIKAMTSAMQFVEQFVHHDSMEPCYGSLLHPGPKDDWAQFARATHDSYHHGVGTCMMGPAEDRMGVVDQRLQVHGMNNLWVADASIMPTIPHANTNLTAIMIGELVASFIEGCG